MGMAVNSKDSSKETDDQHPLVTTFLTPLSCIPQSADSVPTQRSTSRNRSSTSSIVDLAEMCVLDVPSQKAASEPRHHILWLNSFGPDGTYEYVSNTWRFGSQSLQ